MSLLTRYEPGTLMRDIQQVFERNLSPWTTYDTTNADTSQWMPAMDVKEEENQFVILADLPGIDKKDVNISMENNILTINGERQTETKEEQENYSRIERTRGSFYRRFTLPDTADGEKIEAALKKGVLQITIPKKTSAKTRSIDIKIENE